MKGIINAAIERYKTTLMLLLMILVAGSAMYKNISKEAEPDIPIPFISVSVSYDGISPEDSESLLIKPMEKELKGLKNLKEITSVAMENGADVTVEFVAGVNKKVAMSDVRDAVTLAKAELPAGADEPIIKEITMADASPVITILLSGDLSESVMLKFAKQIEDKIETVPEVLKVDIVGKRDEMIEIIISPSDLQNYDLDLKEIFSLLSNNNQLVAAGTLENGNGAYTLKIPGKIDDLHELMNAPVKVIDNRVVTFEDLVHMRRTLKDPDSLARFNGKPAIALLVKKRSGENIINTVEKTKAIVEQAQLFFPNSLNIDYSNDKSINVEEKIYDLQNNVLSSILLVVIVVIAFLGLRSSLLVGVAIPGAFLMGILALGITGITINMVVLFALIMSVGMMVDGAIVVTEFADKKMSEGMPRKEAYRTASQRMAWPIISSTATTLAAFMPLLFWPGQVGEFMKYLPLTVIATLSSSLFMALIVIPALGSLIGKKRPLSPKQEAHYKNLEKGNFEKIGGIEKGYYKLLSVAIKSPVITISAICFVTFTLLSGYVNTKPAVEFFPEVEPEVISAIIKMKGDMSISERSEYVSEIEKVVFKYHNDIESFYTSVSGGETIGQISMPLKNWKERRAASEIIADIRNDFSQTSGLVLEVGKAENGPSQGKDLQLNVKSFNKESLYKAIPEIEVALRSKGYFIELENTLPVNGVEWEFVIDREKATIYGANISLLSNYVRMFTNGMKLSSYRPHDSTDEVDMMIRFPGKDRNMEVLNSLMVKTDKGQVPASYFIEQRQKGKVTSVTRIDGIETIKVMANLKPGTVMSEKMPELKASIAQFIEKHPEVMIDFKGDQEQQEEAASFLANAFMVAMAAMFIIIVTQFNSYYQALIVLSAVVFSTIGAMALYDQANIPFSIVMSGIGIISLAGIVVNNNIVLIESYNHERDVLKRDPMTAMISTGVQRLRPVLLTTITTVLGLVPMAVQLNIDLFQGELVWGAPSSQWWYQLASSVIGGLIYASIVTLILTPCLLVVFKKEYWIVNRIKRAFNK